MSSLHIKTANINKYSEVLHEKILPVMRDTNTETDTRLHFNQIWMRIWMWIHIRIQKHGVLA